MFLIFFFGKNNWVLVIGKGNFDAANKSSLKRAIFEREARISLNQSSQSLLITPKTMSSVVYHILFPVEVLAINRQVYNYEYIERPHFETHP